MYNTFARAGAFARAPMARRSTPRGMVNASTKGVDVSLSSAIVNTTNSNASAILVNAIAPGSASFNRVGRKVTLETLRVKGGIEFTMTPSAAGAVSGNAVRMVVVWDQQPNSGSIPTWDTIFGTTDQGGSENSNVNAPLRYDNMDRFRVLKETNIAQDTIPANVVTTGVLKQYKVVDEYISLGKRSSIYSGQSATCTTADISTGALYVYFRCQTSDATSSAIVDSDTFARLRYKD